MIGSAQADIDILKNAANGGSSSISVDDAVQATLDNIMSNGLFVGDRWWVGQQNDNLYAIDTNASTFYTF